LSSRCCALLLGQSAVLIHSVAHAHARQVVERIDVLRGPAALLYGGSAVDGVFNAIDNRIPKLRIDAPSGALCRRGGSWEPDERLLHRIEAAALGQYRVRGFGWP
jgi:hypothetical protein